MPDTEDGTYLFLGGPYDGQRLFIGPPVKRWQFVIPSTAPSKQTLHAGLPVTEHAPPLFITYYLHALHNAGINSILIYVYDDDLPGNLNKAVMRRLVSGYVKQ